METTKEFISTIGFPILAFLLMFSYCTYTLKANTQALNKLSLLVAKLLAVYDYKDFKSGEKDCHKGS